MRAFLFALALVACTAQPEKQDEAPAQPSAEQAAMSVDEVLAQMPAWGEARAAGVDFRGIGQEPAWMLDIYQQDLIRVIWNYGQNIANFPLVEPTYPQEGATRYDLQTESHALVITIRRAPCQDSMSGAAYPSTVEIVLDGRTLEGCGRSV